MLQDVVVLRAAVSAAMAFILVAAIVVIGTSVVRRRSAISMTCAEATIVHLHPNEAFAIVWSEKGPTPQQREVVLKALTDAAKSQGAGGVIVLQRDADAKKD